MKINQLIAKGLTLGLLLNSTSILSYANTEIPNRYQTLEGEYITIDDSMEGNLEEIEIFGKTMQDSGSKNLFSSKLEKGHIDKDGNLVNSINPVRSVDFIEVKPNTYYSLGIVGYNGYLYIHEYDENYSVLGEKSLGSSARSFQTNHNTKYIKINTYSSPDYKLDIDAKVQLNEGKILLDYEPYRTPNLEDIQGVGDLYVDEDGNPILDSQGRKQYKIKIVSRNKNLFNEEWMLGKLQEGGQGEFQKDDVSSSTDFIKVIPGQSYKFNKAVYVLLYDKNKEYLGVDEGYLGVITRNTSFNVGNAEYIRLYRYTDGRENAMLYYSEYNLENTEYIKMEEQVYNIIIPTQLQKVGDVADKLYWDNSKGRYLIEKNIDSVALNGEEKWLKSGFNTINTVLFYTRHDGTPKYASSYISNSEIPYIKLDKYPEVVDYEFIFIGEDFNIRINKDKLENDSIDSFIKYLKKNPLMIYYQLKNPKIIETNITSKLKIPTYDEKTHVYVDSENSMNPTLKVTVDKLLQVAKEAVSQAESDNTNYNISLARMYTNMLPESLYKDQLQEQLSEVFSSDITFDKQAVTSNIDLYIKSENILQMSLSTNSITFEDFSGVEDMIKENAVIVSVNSSLPYQLNACLPVEIQNSDKSNTMDKQILNVKENSESNYQTFASTTDKVVLKDNCPAGNNLIHGVDIKLSGGIAHEKDVYKTTIKFEVEQK